MAHLVLGSTKININRILQSLSNKIYLFAKGGFWRFNCGGFSWWLCWFFLFWDKSDGLWLGLWECHQLFNDFNNFLNLVVVGCEFLLQFSELSGQFLMSGEHFPESDKSPHHINTDQDCALGIKDISGHNCSVLGEGIG